MASRVFVEVQATVRSGKTTVCGEGMWELSEDQAVLSQLANAIASAVMKSVAQYLETLEFRVELAFQTFSLDGTIADKVASALCVHDESDPARIKWSHGRHRYDRKGVNRG